MDENIPVVEEGDLFIGLSMNRCLRDVANGHVPAGQVAAIICGTNSLAKNFDHAWECYKTSAWYYICKPAMKVIFNFLQPCMIEPRSLTNNQMCPMPGRDYWLSTKGDGREVPQEVADAIQITRFYREIIEEERSRRLK